MKNHSLFIKNKSFIFYDLIKFNNPELLLLLFFSLLYYVYNLNYVDVDYKIQYFLYDYHFGFIKRALVGALFDFLPFKITLAFVQNISIVLLFLSGIFIVKIIDCIN
ncbi:MAG: hypothetical protein LBT29_06930, partial [Flavobacteriaceae bacterium]|nr:hypothetical protein [Flavobacteriaceae bacterium]